VCGVWCVVCGVWCVVCGVVCVVRSVWCVVCGVYCRIPSSRAGTEFHNFESKLGGGGLLLGIFSKSITSTQS